MKQKYIKQFSRVFQGKLLLSLLAILTCQSNLHGQTRSNPLAPESLFNYEKVGTPATAALMQNIVYPINYSNGLPEIKIPLCEVKSGDITLPIYLSYHASGIKLSDVAGFTGLGWNLVAEPMITRTIQGFEDNEVTRTCPVDKETYKNQSRIYLMVTDKSMEHPDEYYYRLLNKQGMFMYSMEPKDPTKKFLPIPYENIRIDWTGRFFKIIDDDGTTYKFNGGMETGGATQKVVGWKASSIVSSNYKDSISFVYATEPIRYQVKVHDDYMVIRDNFDSKSYLGTERDECPEVCKYLPDEWMQDPIVYSTINDHTKSYQRNAEGELVPDRNESLPIFSNTILRTTSNPLTEIQFNQGKLVFTKEPNRPRLQKITVYDLSGNIVKQIQFSYMTNNDKWLDRYYLESIVTTDKDGKPLENYRFSYYKPESLPKPGSRSIDLWGYYNGVYRSDNETLIPWQTITTTIGELSSNGFYSKIDDVSLSFGSKFSREPDEKYMIYGMLNKITHPTGSTDEFIYEAHRYITLEENTRIAGGLRIKQINTRNEGREMKVRTFKYGKDEDGNGYSLISEYFNYSMLNQTLHLGDPLVTWYRNGGWYYAPDYNQYITARQRTFFNEPIWSITHDGGSLVMYDYVTEYNGTPENNSGKTVYQYAIKTFPYLSDGRNTIQRNQHDGWEYGHLTKKVIYKNDMGMYKPLESIENNYSSLKKNFGKILVGEAGANVVIREASSGFIPSEIMYDNDYELTTINVGAKLLLKSKHETYTDGGTVNAITNYEYSDPSTIYPTRIIEVGNDSTKQVTTLTYPKDYKNVYPYTEMMGRNILSPVIKKEYLRHGSYIGIETPFIKSSGNIYKPDKLVVRRDSLAIGDTRATYLYDDHGRIRQEIKDGKESIVYLYGYKNQHIVAHIENATFAEVEALLGSETIKGIATEKTLPNHYLNKLNGLRNSLPASRVTIYTYEPLIGIASITNPLGVSIYYDYDGLGRLTKTYCINNNKEELIESYGYHYAN